MGQESEPPRLNDGSKTAEDGAGARRDRRDEATRKLDVCICMHYGKMPQGAEIESLAREEGAGGDGQYDGGLVRRVSLEAADRRSKMVEEVDSRELMDGKDETLTMKVSASGKQRAPEWLLEFRFGLAVRRCGTHQGQGLAGAGTPCKESPESGAGTNEDEHI